ncbi:uncharacterized protein (TIGR02246 family) [Catalinimonas alkaloidigena]|uniref:YybH family protein n=1 Tax=Catalinimonas alkaloidigena TaxID=1075417 RepID=UPI0024065719|nr:SgcJ/EcaC family oxidoreductase [Catalinimonas alkaloidigena]MDF9798503.1 uncharacterized protein (TIGR02246 family) [Catalinimonas alkaloidigena]
MKKYAILLLLNVLMIIPAIAQDSTMYDKEKQNIKALIDQYAQAREKQDTTLLNEILTKDIDQLVSSGEWRRGKEEARQGMMRSSSSNPGERTLAVEQIRFLSLETAIADARYEIRNTDGSVRKMWSTFVVVHGGDRWRIAAIRNMLPA